MKSYNVSNIADKLIKTNAPLIVSVPGSKSITNRALLLAMLADGESQICGVLFSDDSRHFLDCVKDLGFSTVVDESSNIVTIKGCGGQIPNTEASIYVGSAGTAARFLAATLGVSHGIYHLDASEQMKKRPMAPLLNSLKALGCQIEFESDETSGRFPFTLKSNGFKANEVSVNIDSSSQFLSALLIASVLSDFDFTTNVEGSHGMAYIDMTVKMMKQFGVDCTCALSPSTNDAVKKYKTASGQKYTAQKYNVEPDASAAAYFYAMSPLLGIDVIVPGIYRNSLQGDVKFINVLEEMGCLSEETDEGIILHAPVDGIMHGVTVDMSSFSDQAITLAAIAPFADSPTTITGIGHIRLQESDRLNAIATELTKMGIEVYEKPDAITIYPGMPKPSIVETYEDHRMAMGFSLIGLKADGIIINNPLCCKKTFENYFEVLDSVIDTLTK